MIQYIQSVKVESVKVESVKGFYQQFMIYELISYFFSVTLYMEMKWLPVVLLCHGYDGMARPTYRKVVFGMSMRHWV